MKKTIIYLGVLAATAMSCTDLNEEVFSAIPSENYPETEEQIAVGHLTAYNALFNLFDDNGYWYLAQEISSDELVAPTRGNHWYDGGKWLDLQFHSWDNESDAVVGIWRETMNGIVLCNELLVNLKSYAVKPVGKIAEVETIRSFYYSILMDTYGDVPYITEYHPDPDNAYRNYRTAVYDSLIQTIERNYQYLPTISNPSFKHYASKEMAQALLAKLYLNGKVYSGTDNSAFYEKAGAFCDSLINNSSLSLESNPISAFKVANVNPKEVIFSIPFNDVDRTGFRLHMRTLHYQSKATFDMSAGPWNGFCIEPPHFNLYEEADIRKKGFFLYGPQVTYSGTPLLIDDVQLDIDPNIPYAYMKLGGSLSEDFITNCGARLQKFEIYQGAKESLIVNFPVYRLSDIYLMKAECELRLNGTVTAPTQQLVNEIRKRAKVSEWSIGQITLESVLAERGRELIAEGHRRVDLIRYEKFDKPSWCKGDGTDPNDPGANTIENTFPIPLSATSTNPNLNEEPR